METINVVLILLFLAFVVAPLIIFILIYSLGSQLTSLAKENAKSKPEPPKPEPPKPEPPKPEPPKPEMNNLLPPVIPKPAPNTTKYTCPSITPSGCRWGISADETNLCINNRECAVDVAKNDCKSWGWEPVEMNIERPQVFCFQKSPDIASCKWSELDPTTKIKTHIKTAECGDIISYLSCAQMGGTMVPQGCFIDIRPT
jgi:hypothetical protein